MCAARRGLATLTLVADQRRSPDRRPDRRTGNRWGALDARRLFAEKRGEIGCPQNLITIPRQRNVHFGFLPEMASPRWRKMKAKRPTKRPEEINAALAARKGPVSQFLAQNYRHFNAAALVDSAKGYETHLAAGGKMLVTLAGAMSTAELGISLAEMIRRDKVHAIVCTGANLEEDIFNLVAHDAYERVPHYRHITTDQEVALLDRHMNRVTDTCIPELEAMRRIESVVLDEWVKADRGRAISARVHVQDSSQRQAPLPDRSEEFLDARGQKKNLLMLVRWEMQLGQHVRARSTVDAKNVHTVRTGIEYMTWLAEWSKSAKRLRNGEAPSGFSRSARHRGRFPSASCRCCTGSAAPKSAKDIPNQRFETSYGSYSGAVPNEKITWGNRGRLLIIESDATISAPLIFAWVLGR